MEGEQVIAGTAPTARAAPERRHAVAKPAGIPATGCVLPLRRPPGSRAYAADRPWPPSLATATVETARLVERDSGFADRRLPFQRRNGFWSLTWWCSYGLAEWPRQERIVGAVRGLIEMASVAQRGGSGNGWVDYRALALFNAAVFASTLPGATWHALLAEQVRQVADGLGGEATDALRSLGGSLFEASMDEAPRHRLSWRGRRLVATAADGRSRLASLPYPVEGLWRGVRRVLSEHGFDAPEKAPFDPVRLVGSERGGIRVVHPRPGVLNA